MMPRLLAKTKKLFAFKGPVVPNTTPFKDDGNVDLQAIEPYADYLASIGVRGVYVHGTTGEGFSLSTKEKNDLTKKWWSVLQTRYPDMLGIFNVSSTCLPESQEMARLCESLDVDGIAVMAPIYYRPANVDQLVDYIKLIADAAPQTPLIYYHFPDMTNVQVDLPEFVFKAKKTIPSFVGMKYTSRDTVDISKLTPEHLKDFKIFAGYQQDITPMLAMGVNSAIWATFNFPEPVKLFLELTSKYPTDMSAVSSCQSQIKAFSDQLAKEGYFITSTKRRLAQETQGKINPGKPRPPIF